MNRSHEPWRGLSAIPGFDPRNVAALDLPVAAPIDPSRLTPATLKDRFAHPPSWAPEVRQESALSDRQLRRAAVLIALVERPTGLHVVLTERGTKMRTHAGQIAFPGGQSDPLDRDLIETALREAYEEVALPARQAHVLGMLAPYVTSSRYDITPVVALVEDSFVAKANPQEVAHVFEVPLSFLMDPANHRRHRYVQPTVDGNLGREHEWFSMPYMGPSSSDAQPRQWFIWGATAGMLRNFYRFMAA